MSNENVASQCCEVLNAHGIVPPSTMLPTRELTVSGRFCGFAKTIRPDSESGTDLMLVAIFANVEFVNGHDAYKKRFPRATQEISIAYIDKDPAKELGIVHELDGWKEGATYELFCESEGSMMRIGKMLTPPSSQHVYVLRTAPGLRKNRDQPADILRVFQTNCNCGKLMRDAIEKHGVDNIVRDVYEVAEDTE